MNEHEKKIVETFIVKEKRERYRLFLANPKKRRGLLDRLNHNPDLEPQSIQLLPSSTDIPATLRQHGSPADVYLISDTQELDGKTLPLDDAIREIELNGWGTIVSCIPGRLAYYYGERGERRVLLEKKA